MGFRQVTPAGIQLCRAILLVMLAASAALAQLSPGELSQPHAFLDGVQNCGQCHSPDRKLVPDKCVVCHSVIGGQLASGNGLHGRQGYRECQTCHVEHQGREYELVYWPSGQREFDHTETGYALEGKHVSLACRECHQEKFVIHRQLLEKDKTNLGRTFLGLDRACTSCHFNEHRGQLAANCIDCHDLAGWKPAERFDHSRTRYPLQEKHQVVPCAKCHTLVTDNDSRDDGRFANFKPLATQQCTDCHVDFHKGKLGPDCASCHSPAGWHVTDKAKFDHRRTRYPLEGKHALVTCDQCHSPARAWAALRFGSCRDCHSDFHSGAFAARSSKGACEECHAVGGYTPARFSLTQHDQTDYALRGAHRAIPCNACHVSSISTSGRRQYQFTFTATQCLSCHRDPHTDELPRLIADKGCEFCHSEASWREVAFDHQMTRFPLTGQHLSVPCSRCHTRTIDGSTEPALSFMQTGVACQNCHNDIHRGQFAVADSNSTDCGRCHTAIGWKPANFDHSRQSRFPLDGAHIKVDCQGCHKPTHSGDISLIAYKPLDTACAACHSTVPVVPKENKP